MKDLLTTGQVIHCDDARSIPAPSSLDAVRHIPDYVGWPVALVELDAALFDDAIERVNITLPKRVLRRLEILHRSNIKAVARSLPV